MRVRWTLLLLLLLAGNVALLWSLRGREWATTKLYYDPTGATLEQKPGPGMRLKSAGYDVDLEVSRTIVTTVPVRTGVRGGMADVEAAIRWVRRELRVGAGTRAAEWRLSVILRESADSSKAFVCDTYSRSFVIVMQSMGYPARVIFLSDHITSEVYLPELGQWVLADAIYDLVARAPDGTPLSLIGTMRRLRNGQKVNYRAVVGQEGNDDDFDPVNRKRVEGMLKSGSLFFMDGPLAFERLSKQERVRALLFEPCRAVQVALDHQPRMDGPTRRIRGALAAWNGAGLLAGLGLMRVRRRDRGEPAARAAA